MGTSRNGENLLPERANSFLEERFLMVWKITSTTLGTSLECYYFYNACANCVMGSTSMKMGWVQFSLLEIGHIIVSNRLH